MDEEAVVVTVVVVVDSGAMLVITGTSLYSLVFHGRNSLISFPSLSVAFVIVIL